MGKRAIKYTIALTGLVLATVNFYPGAENAPEVVAAGVVDDGCPKSSRTHTHSSTQLQEFAQSDASGVSFNESSDGIELRKEAGLFKATNFSVNSKVVGICAADFDEDGWTDFIGASDGARDLAFYRNITFRNQEAPNTPRWDDPDYRTTPLFDSPYYMEQNCGGRNGHAGPQVCTNGGGGLTIACADFNNDGHQDFFYARSTYLSTRSVYWSSTNRADIFLGRGDGTFERRYQAISPLSSLNYLSWSTDSTPYDVNGDSFSDLVIGHSLSNSASAVDVFTSNGNASRPTFTRSQRLVGGRSLGMRGALASTFRDFNGDDLPDLVVSGPTEARVWIYDGLPGGGVSQTRRDITSSFRGGATTIVSADFSLDGKPDMLAASDNWNYRYNSIGGYSSYWKNDGTSQPFSGGVTQETSTRYNPYYDFDVGVVLDYDHDPDRTPDVIIADGNHAAGYLVLANRTVAQYAECGDVSSGALELGELEDEEMVVTGARLTPVVDLPSGTSVTFFMSNEEPANWYEAAPCIDDASSYCVSFPKPVGRTVRWKAEICSNQWKTSTPTIRSVEIGFDYTVAKEHFRAGVVVDDGVVYVGSFEQPGGNGHFYALNAGLTETYWDFSTTYNALQFSKTFSSDVSGKALIEFDVSNAGDPLVQETLGVVSREQAEDVLRWQAGKRFGVDGRYRLGAIESSTPAIVGPPSRPNWYPRADKAMREKVDRFISDHSDRKKLALFGSRDGAIHAVHTNPTDIASSENGTEAWAFVPSKIASRMLADFTNDTTSSFPDGSPTVADVLMSDGEMHTVAIVAGGNGSRSVVALDITATILAGGQVVGPKPLWDIVPSGAEAGQTMSKPVVARVLVAGAEKFYVVIATGRASEDPTNRAKGRDVIAVDISTGETMWKFQSECSVTSDIAVFETDDELEEEVSELDGYIDRAVWADACGNVYKVNPAQDLGGTYMESEFGSWPTGHDDPAGNEVKAIFTTPRNSCYTSTGSGLERGIFGTIGVRSDQTGRVALFFGTGGSEDIDPSKFNIFYAIYADTGGVRGCETGSGQGDSSQGLFYGQCTAGSCEKFYGGVVVSTAQVIITQSTDPPIGTGTCEFGSSKVIAFNLTTLEEEFSATTASATVSSLYGDGGAIYFATLAGDIVRLGTPRAENAGDDSVSGIGNGTSDSDSSSSDDGALRLLGWKELH